MSASADLRAALVELDDEYEILGELGRGGSAVVFRARERQLGREVAIKVVRSAFADDGEAAARLAREARMVAQLQHPNIVTLYAVRRLRDHRLALVMQMVPGRTLRDALDAQGPLPWRRAEEILRDVAAALGHAHRGGFVHRDVKPENIFLDDVTGRALLSDFGVARAIEGDSQLTMPGTAIGTPAYMSPEQIDGGALDGRSDLYSLGLVAWEMLSGRRPWEGESLYRTIFRQKRDFLPPVDAFRTDVPERLQYAVELLLEKAPEQRWESAGALLSQLPSARPPGGWKRWRAARKRRERQQSFDGARERGASIVGAALQTLRFRRPTGADDTASTPRGTPIPATGSDASAPFITPLAGPDAIIEPLAALAPPDESPVETMRPEDIARLERVRAPAAGAPVPPTAPPTAPLTAPPTAPQRIAPPEATPVAQPAAAVSPDAATASPTQASPRPAPPAASDLAAAAAAAAAFGTHVDAEEPPPTVRRIAERRIETPAAEAPLPVLGARTVPRRRVTLRPERSARRRTAFVLAGLLIGGATATATFWMRDREAIPTVVRDAGARLADRAGIEVRTRPPDDAPPAAPAGPVRGTAQPNEAAGPGALALATRARDSLRLADSARVADSLLAAARAMLAAARDSAAAAVRRDAEPSRAAAGGALVPPAAPVSGATDTAALPAVPPAPPPARIAFAVDRSRVVAGGRHSCLLSEGGLAWCWGANDRGQLGTGIGRAELDPAPVAGGIAFSQLSAGVGYVCGVARDGTIWCWGDNARGQLGDRTTVARDNPVRAAASGAFRVVRTGLAFTCGLARDGAVWCWGANDAGQLGSDGDAARGSPARVAGDERFGALAVGWSHACAVAEQGAVWCWGRNSSGQLGDGSSSSRGAPGAVASTRRFSAVVAGEAHTCALTVEGEVLCWGLNDAGQVGDGSNQNRSTPALTALPERAVSLVAGARHTCARGLSGQAWCWGRNAYGQLGDGTTTDRSRPVAVVGVPSFASLSASGAHTCGATSAGERWCWGYNVAGQLGDGTRENRARPVRVSGTTGSATRL